MKYDYPEYESTSNKKLSNQKQEEKSLGCVIPYIYIYIYSSRKSDRTKIKHYF